MRSAESFDLQAAVYISSNFTFLKQEFPHVAESASYAEHHVYGDPRASCFHARHALERLVKRVYKIDKTLIPPKVTNLNNYLVDPAFRALVPEVVWQKAEYVRQAGNMAVHGNKKPQPEHALNVVRELAHVLYWVGRTYLRRGAEKLRDRQFDESLIPSSESGTSPVSIDELYRLKRQFDASDDTREEIEGELESLRKRLAAIKAENETTPETRDWDESTTRKLIIDLALQRAGWSLDQARDREYEVRGMPNVSDIGYADYVLWGDDGKPLAVVEAKKTTVDPAAGRQQAKLYADCLEVMHDQRPIIFYTNGYQIYLWDDQSYAPRTVAGFYKKDELATLLHRRRHREPLDVTDINQAIVERHYQMRAIGSTGEHFSKAHRKALLVMATGSGKTRVAVALVDLLQRAGWVKRALFLADRVSLVNQAVAAFKDYLPESSPVNLITEKDKSGRVYVCTYPTMMGLINETSGDEARFGVGHFDIVIIDEAHRSVHQKYGAIFQYFDSLLVGLTATPRNQVDRNTYKLFDLMPGMPTDAYELVTAVGDGYLVPPKVEQVDLRFPRDGIDYDSLSDAEQAQWENLDWGDDGNDELPNRVNARAINSWLFNIDTVDKVLQHLMQHGHKVDEGDRLAKTIIFARNHKHAAFIEERLNHHYPQFTGHFARVIDNYASYPQSLLDDFAQKNKSPHIAISVDMLDTGIDVPEIANLVFFKPVYSRIKFWQMIGRGTRMCPDLFGLGNDKQDFRVFDFCFNFDFFGEHPEGFKTSGEVPLGTRMFQSRVRLLSALAATQELDTESMLIKSLKAELHGEVAAMNRENFIVRMQLEAVDHFRHRASWDRLNEDDVKALHSRVASLPSEIKTDDVESRLFDLRALRMQLALVESDESSFERQRRRILEIAALLEEKGSIPLVKVQLAYLASIQENAFWDCISVNGLEEMRLRLRTLMPFFDKKERKLVYTDFEDEITAVRDGPELYLARMTSIQYEKKIKKYLKSHLDHIVIHRLRTSQPLTDKDLQGLEQTLVKIGKDDGQTLLTGVLKRNNSPSLAHFVRSMVGMDRAAAHEAFSEFLSNRSLTTPQIRFIEMVIEQLTTRGVMEPSALYEAPFNSIHAAGPDALFADKPSVINGVFQRLTFIQSGFLAKVS